MRAITTRLRDDERADEGEADGSDASEDEYDIPDARDDFDEEDDYMTDDGVEAEVDHPAENISWKQSKQWAEEAKVDDFIRECGTAVWRAPVHRHEVPSLSTGPEQETTFNVDGNRKPVDLLLDALPIHSFWRRVVAHQSWIYAQQNRDKSTRQLKKEWFTAANYLRSYAVLLMSGVVEARDYPELFKGTTRGRFHRTGAEEVCGIKINVFEQLMRFKHFVNNRDKLSASNDDFDKCFHVRPMITFVQKAISRWCNPGKNNSMDEAGLPSRSPWMRTFNPSKPSQYFIELLMACCSTTKFCWAFFVTESAKKRVLRRHRERVGVGARSRNQSKFVKVKHYQREYSESERAAQDRFGPATAQMLYFARILRERYPAPVTYRLFVDRRWDSLPGIVLARKNYNVSYTATVKFGSRYHILKHWGGKGGGKVIIKSKARNRRGKYRAATTTIAGVVLNEVLWNDSALLGGCSADLGSENEAVVRRTGRHTPPIASPRLMTMRSKHLRGVDVHDQLRSSKYRITFQSRSKGWPKLDIGVFEILVVDVYVIKKQVDPSLKQDDFRWNLIAGMVQKADELDAEQAEKARHPLPCSPTNKKVDNDDDPVPDRFDGVNSHHHDKVEEYVTPQQAQINRRIAAANPTARKLNRKPRRRDRSRKTNKVRNPLYTSASVCLVCKYQYGRRRETLKYCRECNVETFKSWPKTNRATGFATKFHPRLCSQKCFDYFHTHTIKGLDYARKRQREPSSASNTPDRNFRNRNTHVSSAAAAPAVADITTPNNPKQLINHIANLIRAQNPTHQV